MLKKMNPSNGHEIKLYNNIVSLSRNKLLYTKFMLSDTFQNRIHLIFIHISFLFVKINQKKGSDTYKNFHQKLFDLLFVRIEQNMREIGHGDVTVNKNMKILVKTFYNVLLDCENYKKKGHNSKNLFFSKSLDFDDVGKDDINALLSDYFDKYADFCFDLKSDSVLIGDLNFKYK